MPRLGTIVFDHHNRSKFNSLDGLYPLVNVNDTFLCLRQDQSGFLLSTIVDPSGGWEMSCGMGLYSPHTHKGV